MPEEVSVCIKVIQNRTIELRVQRSAPQIWGWSIRLQEGVILQQGAAISEFAARQDVQHAFRMRLKKAGVYKIDDCDWQKLGS